LLDIYSQKIVLPSHLASLFGDASISRYQQTPVVCDFNAGV
jgi:hypothetical protein